MQQYNCFPEATTIGTYCFHCDKDAMGMSKPDLALVALTLCRTYLFLGFVYKRIKTNSFLDESLTFISLGTIFDFVRAQSDIQECKQGIRASRDLFEEAATYMGSFPLHEMEAQQQLVSEILRNQRLTIQELESRVERQSSRLEERRSIFRSLEKSFLALVRLLTISLREATAAIE
jgi:hypothetical protein